jgi:hypothetical protein
VILPMNAKLLIAAFSTLLLTLAGTAAAVGGDLAGLVRAEADASGRVDYSGAFDAFHEAEDEAEATVRDAVESTTEAATARKASADAKLTYEIDQGGRASGEARGGLLGGVRSNFEAFGAWAKSLYVKPSAGVEHATDVDGALGAVGDAASQDGSLDASLGQDLSGVGRVDYNLPPPPTPDVGFVHSIKLAFAALLEA